MEETEVYLAILASFEQMPGLRDVAFVSSPTTCVFGPPEAFKTFNGIATSFLEANNSTAKPIRLALLEGTYNVVSWEDTKFIHETEGWALRTKKSDKSIAILSRVGFSRDRRHALACVEGPNGAEFYLLGSKQEIWKSWLVKEGGFIDARTEPKLRR